MGDTDGEDHKVKTELPLGIADKSLTDPTKDVASNNGLLGVYPLLSDYHTELESGEDPMNWDLTDHSLDLDVLRKIEEQIEDVKLKDSGDTIDRTGLSPETVEKIRRLDFAVNDNDLVTSPDDVERSIVYSPNPFALESARPGTLPWFGFSRVAFVYPGGKKGHVPILRNAPGRKDQAKSLSNKHIIAGLRSVVFCPSLKDLNTTRRISRVGAILRLIMPEWRQGHVQSIAEALCKDENGLNLPKCLQVILFRISNNFPIEMGEQDHQSLNADEWLMSVFRASGLDTAQTIRYLLSIRGPTAHAITTALFASAIRTDNLKTVQNLLKAGMNPPPFVRVGTHRVSPLLIAAKIKDKEVSLEMTRLLLPLTYVGRNTKLSSALCIATRAENQPLMEWLLRHGAYISGNTLVAAIEAADRSLFGMLLGVDPNVNKCAECPNCVTVLGILVARGDVPLTEIVIGLGADLNALQNLYFEGSNCQTTALGLAAYRGNHWMIDLLLIHSAHVNHEAAAVVPPLVLAVAQGHNEAALALIQGGADVSKADTFRGKTLVERALAIDNVELARMLMVMGARSGQKVLEDYYTAVLIRHIKEDDIETVRLLLGWGARVNDEYDETPDTALGAAIKLANGEMFELIFQAGGTNIGQRLRCLGNIHAAKFLEGVGILPQVLIANGKAILVDAIGRGDEELVRYLLDLEVDQQRRPEIDPAITEQEERLFECVLECPLSAAIVKNNLRLAIVLLERGAPVHEHELVEALRHAQKSRNFGFLRLLLPRLTPRPYAAPNALAYVISHENADLLHLLLNAGVDPRGEVTSGLYIGEANLNSCQIRSRAASLLEIAAEKGHRSILQTLLRATKWTEAAKGRALALCLHYGNGHLVPDFLDERDLDLSQEFYRKTPLQYAVRQGDIGLVIDLLDAGANVNHLNPGPNELSVLQSAVDAGNKGIVRFLIKDGADVNLEPSPFGGRTALQVAALNGNRGLVEVLLKAGADVNQRPAYQAGGTALQFAARRGYISIARRLLEAGADVNAPGSPVQGKTALEESAHHGRIDMLQLLLNEGASIEGDGRKQYIRAIVLAETNTHYAAAELLRSHGGWSEADNREYTDAYLECDRERSANGERVALEETNV